MNDDNFDLALTRFRTKVVEAIGPVEREERESGPFGNQIVTLTVAKVLFEVVLDRGSVSLNVGPSDSGERYSLQFLHALLFPAGPRLGLAIESADLRSIVEWLRRARGSGSYSCYKKAYDTFERCLNFAGIGESIN
jgi:hypothetical protein